MHDDTMGYDESPLRIQVMGVGKVGAEAVRKMAGKIYKVECIVEEEVTAEIEDDIRKLHLLIVICSEAEPEAVTLALRLVTISKVEYAVRVVLTDGQSSDGTSELPIWPPEVSRLVVKNECLIPLYEDASGIMQQTGMRNILFRLAVQSITDIITQHQFVCVDFADVHFIMQSGGTALLGIGYGSGSERGAADAVQNALSTTNYCKNRFYISGLIVTIYGSSSLTLYDFDSVVQIVSDDTDHDASLVVSIVLIEELGQNYRVSVVAMTNAVKLI